MIIKAEPVSVIRFIANHFLMVRDLFDVQRDEQIIRKEVFDAICDKNSAELLRKQLFDYKIVRLVQDNYELHEVYYNLVEFVIAEFRPMLPEEIEKYGSAISELFRKIMEGIAGDQLILETRIRSLSKEIRGFTDSIDRNRMRLLSETRDLKANVSKIDYREKIAKASHWTEHYILPMNKILDVNHSESIANKLFEISEFANQKRLNFPFETARLEFEKLYSQLMQAEIDLRHHHRALLGELLPLLERIKTESVILTGWINFLKNPYKVTPPPMFSNNRNYPTSYKLFLLTKEYFEQFANAEDAIIDDLGSGDTRWMFDKGYYRDKLVESLPNNDFFAWCGKTLKNEGEITNEKFLSLTTLLYEKQIKISDDYNQKSSEIKTRNARFIVPQLKLTKNEI